MLTNEEKLQVVDVAEAIVTAMIIGMAACVCKSGVKLNPFVKLFAATSIVRRLDVIKDTANEYREKYKKAERKNYDEFKRRSVNLSSGETGSVVNRIGF